MPPSVSSKRPNLNFDASVHRNQKLKQKYMRQIGSCYSLTIPFGTRPCHQLMQTYRYRPLQQAAVVPEKGKKPSGGKKKSR